MISSVENTSASQEGLRESHASQCGSQSVLPWFCLRTKPGQEPVAFSELRNQHFPVFYPLKAGAKGIEGLFPGYLFSQPHEDGTWAPMRHTRGVASIMMSSSSRPSVLPPGAMDAIRARLSDDGIMWPEPSRQIGEGARFRVADDHQFGGLIAACSRTAHDRVYALIEILGRRMEVGFERNHVQAVED